MGLFAELLKAPVHVKEDEPQLVVIDKEWNVKELPWYALPRNRLVLQPFNIVKKMGCLNSVDGTKNEGVNNSV